MKAFESLALALRGHFEKPFAQLSPALQQRVQADFAPWSWDGKGPRQRCHRAKQWDYENDPALREVREGIEALTNPESPSYSLKETKRLRGDLLPEPRYVQSTVALPAIEWEGPQPTIFHPNVFGTSSIANNAVPRVANGVRANSPRKAQRRNLLSPLIDAAQAACPDPYKTPSVWSKLREMAVAKTAPFIGATDEGLQWIDEHDQTQYLSLKNLRDTRLARALSFCAFVC